MAFIGNTVQTQGFTPAIDYFNGNGVTVTFTLSRPIASVAQVIVAVDNVIQNPSSAFGVVGNSITFTSAPLSGTNNIWVEYTSLITTYQGISQDPTVIGDIRATGGYLAEGDFGNSFVDGNLIDYVTGAGRLTVGELDDLVFYHGGTSARSEMMRLSYAGNSTLEGKLTATGNGSFQGVYIGRGTGAISTNTAVGASALNANTTGSNNTAVGYQAGYFNTTGIRIVAVGNYALYGNTTGNYNVAMGYEALAPNTTGSNNTAIGHTALQANTTASNNTAVGYQALYSNTTGTQNLAVGGSSASFNAALYSNTTGYQNVAVGHSVFSANTTGAFNTGLGDNAARANTTGDNNVAIGEATLVNNSTGSWNVAVGRRALLSATESYNVGVGGNAGYGITTGSRNTCLGHEAGNHTLPITTGNYNTILGAFTLPSGNNAQYQICLGYDVVCIGDNYFTFGRSGNRVYNEFTSNASWTRSSDVRLKKDINTNTELGLSFINDLRTVSYKWKAPAELDPTMPDYDASKEEADYKKKMYGFIAQEVKESLDKHGITDFNGWHVTPDEQGAIQGVSYEMFVIPLIKAIQEQQQIITDLKARIEALEAK